MHCTVLLFAQAREACGCDRLQLELPDGSHVLDAMEQLVREHTALVPLRERLAVAIDQRYASMDQQLPEGCTLALIPPVSGG